MTENKVYTAVGLMSGTSLDGIDCALIETNGQDQTKPVAFKTYSYTPQERDQIKKALGHSTNNKDVQNAADIITKTHINITKDFIKHSGKTPDIIGFHGQTIFHDPAIKKTWQIGDPQALADALQVNVVADMRQNDIAAGGQGAPLLPLCHQSFAQNVTKPVVILNLGGVANITWLGTQEHEILAFDTGPANALIDDLVRDKTNNKQEYDTDGKLAQTGTADQALLTKWLGHSFFTKKPPKSLDRDEWNINEVYALPLEDAAATLSEFTIQSIRTALEKHLPAQPAALYVTGGGRHNHYIMKRLKQEFSYPVAPVEDLGWNGDGLEAQGFAYLAVRSLLGLPLTLPQTTGVPSPMTGGTLYQPK